MSNLPDLHKVRLRPVLILLPCAAAVQAVGSDDLAPLLPQTNIKGRIALSDVPHRPYRDRQLVRFSLTLENVNCSFPSNASATCSIAVLDGGKCGNSSERGDEFWNRGQVVEDPWPGLRFITEGGIANSASLDRIEVQTGFSANDFSGRVVVVRDAFQNDVACSLLHGACTRVLGTCMHIWGLWLAGIATLIAVFNSSLLVSRHWRKNKHPAMRRYTLRILLMVPLYCVQAYVSLSTKTGQFAGEVLKTARELYEAIVIFAFLQFVLICVGGPEKVAAWRIVLPAESEDSENGTALQVEPGCRVLHHVPPMNWMARKGCVPEWRSSRQMLAWCVRGTLSYVLVGAVGSMLGLVLWLTCDYETPPLVMRILAYALSTAQTVAIVALAELASNMLKDLEGLKPIQKVLSVKMVVFFTFWQEWALQLMQSAGLFDRFIDLANDWVSGEQIVSGLQNFLICLEMMLISFVHHSVFPPNDYEVVFGRLGLTVDDVSGHLRNIKHRRLRKGLEIVDCTDIVHLACTTRTRANVRPPCATCDVAEPSSIEEESEEIAYQPAPPEEPVEESSPEEQPSEEQTSEEEERWHCCRGF